MVLTGENRSTGRKPVPRAMLHIRNSTWTVLSLKPGLRGDKPAAGEIYCEFFNLNCKLSLGYDRVSCAGNCAGICASCHVLITVNIIAVVSVLKAGPSGRAV